MFPVGGRNAPRRDFGNFGDNFFDVFGTDDFFALLRWKDFHCGADFINHVNCFIRQAAIVDVFGRELHRRMQRRRRIVNPMMFFVVWFQSLKNFVGLVDARFGDFDFLKAARERPVAFEVALVVVIGRRSDALELA